MSEFDNLKNEAEQVGEKEGKQELQDKFGIGGQQGQQSQGSQGGGRGYSVANQRSASAPSDGELPLDGGQDARLDPVPVQVRYVYPGVGTAAQLLAGARPRPARPW